MTAVFANTLDDFLPLNSESGPDAFIFDPSVVRIPTLSRSEINPGPLFSYWKFTNVFANAGFALNLVDGTSSEKE